MKKLLIICLCFLNLTAKAQTVEILTSLSEAEATAKGYAIIEGGYTLPKEATVSDFLVTVTTKSATSEVKNNPVAAGNGVYAYFYRMGSTSGRKGFSSLPDFDDMNIDGCAILQLAPQATGKITMKYSSNTDNTTMYVWDVTANSGKGLQVLANQTPKADSEVAKLHTAAFTVVENHQYYVFSSESNVELYSMLFDAYKDENSSYVNLPTTDNCDEVVMPITAVEAETKGYNPMWANYMYGYEYPSDAVISETDLLKVENVGGVGLVTAYPPYVAQGGKGIYDRYLSWGSKAGRNGSYPVVDLNDFYESNNSILKITPKKDGRIKLCYSRGTNNSTQYVWNMTDNGETGLCVLTNMTFVPDGSSKLCHNPEFNVQAGQTYYAISSDKSIEFYCMGFTAYGSDKYSKQVLTGIVNAYQGAKENGDAVYNLSGQRVNKNYKGVVIKGGHKYFQ